MCVEGNCNAHALQRRQPFLPRLAEKLLLRQNEVTMKILAVSDQVVDRVYQLVPEGHFADVEMILGCGDLPYDYLEYIVSILNVPLFYVPGNHDPAYEPRFAGARAEGGTNLDLKTTRCMELLLAGFGGSVRYRPDGVNQYTQLQAFLRAVLLVPALVWNHLRYGRALDILITHSPPYGIHDEEGQAHRGLKAINWLVHWARPRWHLHGHMHFVRRNLAAQTTKLGRTSITNVHPYKVIEI